MEISEASSGGAKVLLLKGRLDTATVPIVEARLMPLIQPGARIVADNGAVNYISSAGLRLLLKAAKLARQADARFTLAAPQVPVREVLEISGFDKVLGIHPTVEEAAAG